VIAMAKQLGETKPAGLLNQTLEEEKETDAKLTSLAETINPAAAEGVEESAGKSSSPKRPRTGRAA